METLDGVAGGIELVLVPASVGLLMAACGYGRALTNHWGLLGGLVAAALAASFSGLGVSFADAVVFVFGLIAAALAARVAARWRGVRTPAIALAVLTALTVAQPLGVRASPLGQETSTPAIRLPAAADRERSVDPTQSHTIDVLGVPIFGFALYRREIVDLLTGLGECCPPTHTLRARSWLHPALLTHATELGRICGDRPCWTPRRQPPDRSLELWRQSDGWYVSLTDRRGQPPVAWRLGLGVVSVYGLVYWLAAIGAVAILLGRRRLAAGRRV